MVTVTGLTALRMLAIEAASIVSGVVENGRLYLRRYDGEVIDAGLLPPGPTGPPGSITVSPAGGDLSGNYPNPTIRNGVISEDKLAEDLVEGLIDVPSLRTLGSGEFQAAPGNHSHVGLNDTGWINMTTVAGETPFSQRAVLRAQYRKVGKLVHVRFDKESSALADRSNNLNGNFPNVTVLGEGMLPVIARPDSTSVNGAARFGGSPTTLNLTPTGAVQWAGGHPRVYPSGSIMSGDFVYFTNN